MPTPSPRLPRCCARFLALVLLLAVIPPSARATPLVNVRANDPTGDAVDAAQHSPSIAATGGRVWIAFEDRPSASSPFPDPRTGFAWSGDGGASFLDAGAPPPPAGWRWAAEPGVTWIADAGVLAYWGQVTDNVQPRHVGLGFVTGVPGPLGVTWGTPVVARQVEQSFLSLPVIEVAAGTAPGVIGYLHSDVDTPALRFGRSTDGGQNWSPEQVVWEGSASEPRLVRGVNGDFWAFWLEGGNSVLCRHSPDDGATFEAPQFVASFYDNVTRPSNSTAPAFSLVAAIDDTDGPHHGRVYVAFTSAYDFTDDPLPAPDDPSADHVVEVEPNETLETGTPCEPGAVLRGNIVFPDIDVFTVTLDRGECVIVHPDSTGFSGRVEFSDGNASTIVCLGLTSLPGTFCAPATGSYTLRVLANLGSLGGSYRVVTAPGVRSSSPALDDGDILVAWSDDGIAWAPPVRVNRDPEGHDDRMPSIAVGRDGYLYAGWHDFEGNPSAGASRFTIGRTRDGGPTWKRGVAIGDPESPWAFIQSNSLVMGIQSALASSDSGLVAAWPDTRTGNPDVWTAVLDTRILAAATPPLATAAPGRLVLLQWTLENANTLFGNDVAGTVTFDRAWGEVPVAAALDPDGTTTLVTPVTVPDTAAVGPVAVTLDLAFEEGAHATAAAMTLVVDPSLAAVGSAVVETGLRSIAPTPARGAAVVEWALAAEADAVVEILDVTGARVRTLATGRHAAGIHRLRWDGHDAHGRPAAAGVYLVHLRTGDRDQLRRLPFVR